MVRRFDEPIQVQFSTPAAGQEQESPTAFLWRGRVYAVRAVDGHWKERRAWWRAERTDRPAGDRRVWRVQAQAGRLGSPGVYELGLDGADSDGAWVLLRAHD